MSPTLRVWLVAIILALLGASCASDSDDTTGAEASPGAVTAPDDTVTSTTAAPPTSAAPAPTPSSAPTTTQAPARLPAAYLDHTSEHYGELTNWLCHPAAADDVCRRDLDATAVAADGSTELRSHEPATDPAADCFYVYPTVSRDPGYLSDFTPGEQEEINAVVNQAARLSAHCALYAPVYRQNTLASLFDSAVGEPPEEGTYAVAYGDVLDAFREYIANHSEGRPFVLIGHSQGAGLLRELIAEEIDGEPALANRLVAAYLLGTSVAVPEGEVVGGDFTDTPLCTSADDTGCVVTYASFRSTAPPPETSFFGRVSEPGQQAGCVDPTELLGTGSTSQPYFADAEPYADGYTGDEITTPYVTFPDYLELACVDDGTFSYLEVTVLADPADNRVDDITGDLTPDWGLHLIDANIAMGDIVDLTGRQLEAHQG